MYKEQWQLKDGILFQVKILPDKAEDQQHSYLNATAKDTLFFHDGNSNSSTKPKKATES